MIFALKRAKEKFSSALWCAPVTETVRANGRLDKRLFQRLLPWIALILCYLRMVFYMVKNWASLLNSDMAAEMMLAQMLNKSGGILSADWYYSTELRVINTQLVYRIGLLLFPGNWHMARVFSVAVLLLILVICYLFLFKTVGIGSYGVWATALLLCPFSRWYAYNMLIGCYYVPHVAFSAVSISLLMLYCREERLRTRCFYLIALGGAAFLSCLGGVRQLQICYVPMVAASILWDITLLWPDSRHFSRLDIVQSKTFTLRHNQGSCIAFLCGVIGYIVNSAILAKHFRFYSFGEVTWWDFSLERLLNVFSNYLASFGFLPSVRLISLNGISSALGLMAGAITVVACFRILRKGSVLSLQTVFLTDLFLAMIVVNLFSLSQLNAVYHESYLVPLLPFAIMVLFLDICQNTSNRLRKSLAIVFVSFALFLCSYSRLCDTKKLANGNDIRLANVASWLVQNGYTQGYAKFWQGDVLVEYTSGKLEVWVVSDAKTLEIYDWLQPIAHNDAAPKGDSFLLLQWKDIKEDPSLAKWFDGDRSNLLYDDGEYCIAAVNPDALPAGVGNAEQ